MIILSCNTFISLYLVVVNKITSKKLASVVDIYLIKAILASLGDEHITFVIHMGWKESLLLLEMD